MPPRHKDPRLLTQLKSEWAEYGCAVCGRQASIVVPSGMGVELHHVWPRGRGGPDARWNVIGLCGELTDCKAHWKTTTERYRVDPSGKGLREDPGTRVDWGFLWTNRRTAEQQQLRTDPCYPTDAEEVPEADSMLTVSPGGFGGLTVDSAESPSHTPQERFAFLRNLYRDAENRRVACALVLAWVERTGEFSELGYESMGDYVRDCGIEKGDYTKMRLVGKTFHDRWPELDGYSRKTLTLEKLYYAARLVRDKEYPVDDALHAAVGNTTMGMIALVRGDEPSMICTCPTCGRVHYPTTRESEAVRG